MATTKKKAAKAATVDLFDGLDEGETKEVIARFRRLALNLRNIASEFTEIIEILESPKPSLVRTRKDANDEPAFKYLVRVRIPADFFLTKRIMAYAADQGFTPADTKRLFAEMSEYYNRVGTKWQDWTAVAYKWYRTEAARRKDKAPQGPTRTSKSLQEFK